MINQEDAKIYFGREVLSVLEEGDLVESESEFGRAVYVGPSFIYEEGRKLESIKLIKRDHGKVIKSLKYLLEDISLIGRKIITLQDEHSISFRKRFESKDIWEAVGEHLISQRLSLYGNNNEEYEKLDRLLRRHKL